MGLIHWIRIYTNVSYFTIIAYLCWKQISICCYLYHIHVIYLVPKDLIKFFILTGIIFMWKQKLFSKILASVMVAINRKTRERHLFLHPKLVPVARFSQVTELPLPSGKQLSLEVMSSISNFCRWHLTVS